MSEILFNVGGQVMDAARVKATAQKAAPRVAKDREAQHGGFLVEGYAPGRIEAAQTEHTGDKPWDESIGLRKNKPTRVGRPYVVPAAADLCAAMAAKDGWQYVQVRELIRQAS